MRPRQRLIVARLAYVALVVLATLADLHFSPDLDAARWRLARALTPTIGWRDAVDGLRNGALFAGFGMVWVVTSLTGRWRGEIMRATIVGTLLSLFVEVMQCFSPRREASIVDVGTNASGVVIGAVVALMLLTYVQRARGQRSCFGVPALMIAGGYLVATLCEAVTPLFHSDFIVAESGGPLFRAAVSLHMALPLSFAEVPVLNLPLFAAAGFLAVLLLAERGRSVTVSALMVAATAVPVFLTAHLAHGLYGLPIRFEAASTDILGTMLGAWMAHRWPAMSTREFRGAARARALLTAYGALLLMWGWRPFLPRTSLSAIGAQLVPAQVIPLASLAGRVDVFSAVHVLQQFALYVPLGALLAVWPCRTAGRWRHLWPAVVLATIIEVGHLAVEGRTFDVTNALIACSGLAIGWTVIRRTGYAAYGESFPARRLASPGNG